MPRSQRVVVRAARMPIGMQGIHRCEKCASKSATRTDIGPHTGAVDLNSAPAAEIVVGADHVHEGVVM
jgi:hypothetical protein